MAIFFGYHLEMVTRPYRLEPQDKKTLDKILSSALGGEFVSFDDPPPILSKRSGMSEIMGAKICFHIGKRVRQGSDSYAYYKISIRSDDWVWDGSVLAVVVSYIRMTNAKKVIRGFDIADTGLLSGDESKFERDLILLRMMKD